MLALAAGLIQEMKLGQGASPDLLSIGVSATDYVGHTYGPGGQEMCLQLLSLDRDLGDFFGLLDRSGLDYAVALTADHGGEDIPERLRLKGVAAARVDPALAASEMGKRIAAKLKLSGPVLIGDFAGDIYCRSRAQAGRPRPGHSRSGRGLFAPPASRGGVHLRPAPAHGLAERQPRPLDADPARAGIV